MDRRRPSAVVRFRRQQCRPMPHCRPCCTSIGRSSGEVSGAWEVGEGFYDRPAGGDDADRPSRSGLSANASSSWALHSASSWRRSAMVCRRVADVFSGVGFILRGSVGTLLRKYTGSIQVTTGRLAGAGYDDQLRRPRPLDAATAVLATRIAAVFRLSP
jgi:hypothetical protein